MDYEIKLPEGQKFKVSGPEGFTQEQAWAALQQQISQAPGADPELLGFDPHRAEAQTDPMGFGQLQRAGAAFAGSAEQDIGSMKDALWSIISDPKAAGKALYELGPSGVGKEIWHDLTRKYGSQERIQKTLETDPFGLLMDVATLGTGGLGVIRKIGMGVAKVAEKGIPPIAGKLSKVAPESLARAGEVGRLGPAAPESAEYTAALRGQPSPIAAATRGQQAAPAMAARQAMAPFGQAGQELRAGGWAPKDVGKKLFGGGGAAALHGALPGWLGAAVGHGAAPVTAAAIAGSSPRLMGATMRGLGATQRGLQELPYAGTAAGATLGGLTRDQLQNYARDLLKDKAAKADLTDPERKIVRAARRGNADSNIMLAARGIIQRRMGAQSGALPMSPMAQVEPAGDNSYGGTSGDVPSRQEGGPVEAGKVYGVGEQGPETYVPSMTGPAASPGLARSPVTGEAPVAQTHGGKTFFEFAWDKLMSGESLSQQALKAFVEPEAYDPSGPMGAALATMGATPFGIARAGEGAILGAGPRLPTPRGTQFDLFTPAAETARTARAAEQHYTLDAYHGTRSPREIGTFETGNIYDDSGELIHAGSGDPNSYIGPHFSREPTVAGKFAEGRGADWLKTRHTEGDPSILPIKLNAKKIHEFKSEKELNDHVYDQKANTPTIDEILGEDENAFTKYEKDASFRADVNRQAVEMESKFDEPMFETAQQLGEASRADFEKRGITTVQYPNEVEGGTSYIAIEPPRSRFAQFDPKKKGEGYILGAGPTSKPAGAALAAAGALKHGISEVKLPRPIEEMEATRKGTPAPSKLITPADLQGGIIFPAIGDRSMAGQTLTGVGGQRLPSPVQLQGGPRYMPEQAGRGSIWASGPGIITRLENRAQELARGGKPVYMPYSAMGERAVDFAHHVSDTLTEMMKTAKVTKKSATEFDAAMRKKTADWPAIKDWPGVQSKGLRKYLMDAGGNVRNKFAKTMDTRQFQDAGFPSVAEARHAVTDPRLLHEPTGAAGLEIGETMPGAPRPPPEHRTYESGLPGIYRGGFGASVPREIMFPDPMRKISQMQNPNRAFSMQLPAQQTHQQWVDSVSAFLRKYRGIPLAVTAGMSIPELKRLLNEAPSDRQ